MVRPALLRSLLGVTLVALSLLAPGEESQAAPLVQIGGEVLDVVAKHLDVDLAKGEALLEGDVQITLGQLNVSCARVDIKYDEAPQVKWARGVGGVRVSLKGIVATAQTLEVEVPERRVRLVGNVKVTRGKGWIQAERANIDLPTGKVSLEDVKGSIPIEAANR